MAEFLVPRPRRNSDCSEVSCASVRSLDHPPSFKRHGNQPMGKRSRHYATLINPGPPRLYQLNTERTHVDGTDKRVRRWTYGRRDRNKQNKVILMVGETGSGKTTMINTMVNHLLGVKFEDQEFYHITEEKREDQSQSLTSEITVYEVFVERNPISLTIIDTPGYGDTEGFKQEREISDDLGRLFTDEDFHHIDAVCFVMKASDNRLSRKECYMFQSVLSLFGKDIENNIVFIITHSDGRPPTDALSAISTAEIRYRRDESGNPVHFLFNNQQEEQRAHAHKTSWEMGEKSMEAFLKLLLENNRKQTLMNVEKQKERKQLEARVFNLMGRITEKESELEHRVIGVSKTVKEKVWIEYSFSSYDNYVTSCTVCKENCHEFGCWRVPSFYLSKCDVMKDDYCTVCTGRCHYSKHIKENRKYVTKTRRVNMSFHELKQKNKSTSDLTKTSSDEIAKIEEKYKEEKSILLHEAYILIMKLSENLLTADWYFTAEHLDFFISRLKEEGKNKEVRDLEKVRKSLEERKNTTSMWKEQIRH